MLYTFAPRRDAFGVMEPMLESKKRIFATVPHSASRVDCWFGRLLLSGSTPTDLDYKHLGGKSSSAPSLHLSKQIRLWHSEELILAPSNLVVAGDYNIW